MSLVNIWNDTLIETNLYDTNQNLVTYFPTEFQEYFIQAAVVNGTAMLRPEPKGSKTEIALLEFIERCQTDYEVERQRCPASIKFPFSSARKRMSMVLELPGGRRRLVSKGASEMILAACNTYHSKQGQILVIDESLREKMEKAIE